MSLTDFIDRSRSNPGATRADGRQETEFGRQNTEDRIPANGARDSQTPNPELKPSRPPSIIVATTGWSLLADPLEGVRSVGAVK